METSIETTKKVQRKTFDGVVVSNKADKTVSVRVDRTVVHPKYRKRYIRSKTYSVHDEKNTAQVGQKVRFVDCRPYSKTKRWRLINTSA